MISNDQHDFLKSPSLPQLTFEGLFHFVILSFPHKNMIGKKTPGSTGFLHISYFTFYNFLVEFASKVKFAH